MNGQEPESAAHAAGTQNRQLLYHYTAEEGLIGITENDNIRATHVRFLNDWTEFLEAFKEQYVQELAESFIAGLPENIDEVARKVMLGMLSKRNYEEILGITRSPNWETFVCSFSGDAGVSRQASDDPGDRLTQWRAYSHSSQGYSLGFDKELLRKQTELNNPKAKASLLECLYEDEKKILLFREFGCEASRRFNELRHSNEPVREPFPTKNPNASDEYIKLTFYFQKSLSEATAKFFRKAAEIKHCGFREEFEWRIVLQIDRNTLFKGAARLLKFRNGPFGRTPYIEIPLGLKDPKTSPLRRIVIGPSVRGEDIKHSVELMLLNRGIQVAHANNPNGVEVVASRIPYRSA